jgi:hypothetical protein
MKISKRESIIAVLSVLFGPKASALIATLIGVIQG